MFLGLEEKSEAPHKLRRVASAPSAAPEELGGIPPFEFMLEAPPIGAEDIFTDIFNMLVKNHDDRTFTYTLNDTSRTFGTYTATSHGDGTGGNQEGVVFIKEIDVDAITMDGQKRCYHVYGEIIFQLLACLCSSNAPDQIKELPKDVIPLLKVAWKQCISEMNTAVQYYGSQDVSDGLVGFNEAVNSWIVSTDLTGPPTIEGFQVPIIYGIAYNPNFNHYSIIMQVFDPPRNDVGQDSDAQQTAATNYSPPSSAWHAAGVHPPHPGSHLTVVEDRDIDNILRINRLLELVGICHNDLLKIHFLTMPQSEVPQVLDKLGEMTSANPLPPSAAVDDRMELLTTKSSPERGIPAARGSQRPREAAAELVRYLLNPTLDIFKIFHTMQRFPGPEYPADLWSRVWPIKPPDPRSIPGNCIIGKGAIWFIDFGATSPLRGDFLGDGSVKSGENIARTISSKFALDASAKSGQLGRHYAGLPVRLYGGGRNTKRKSKRRRNRRNHRKKKRTNQRMTNKRSKKRTNQRMTNKRSKKRTNKRMTNKRSKKMITSRKK